MRLINEQGEGVRLKKGDVITYDRAQEKIYFSRPDGTKIYFLKKGFRREGLRADSLGNAARFRAAAWLVALTHGFEIIPLNSKINSKINYSTDCWQYQFSKPS